MFNSFLSGNPRISDAFGLGLKPFFTACTITDALFKCNLISVESLVVLDTLINNLLLNLNTCRPIIIVDDRPEGCTTISWNLSTHSS